MKKLWLVISQWRKFLELAELSKRVIADKTVTKEEAEELSKEVIAILGDLGLLK